MIYITRQHFVQASFVLVATLLTASLLWPSPGLTTVEVEQLSSTELKAEPQHSKIAQTVARLVFHAHFRKQAINNDLSKSIYNNYIDALDPNKLYFTQEDINALNQYADTFDDGLRNGDIDPVFDIYKTFRARVNERIGFALETLKIKPDFEGSERFDVDRSDTAWEKNIKQLDRVWTARVKNDALSLMLADKNWEETVDILSSRYERLQKRTNQLDSNEVFELFVNAFTHSFDPHSNYLSPSNSEEYRIHMSLSYEGIGASLQMQDDYVTIVEVLVGGPAKIDGRIQAQDRITGVGQANGEDIVDVVGWRLEDVVKLIRGPKSSPIVLKILPAGSTPGEEEILIKLTREEVKLEARAAHKQVIPVQRNGRFYNIGVINVPSFYQDFAKAAAGEKNYTSTTADVSRLVNELRTEDQIDALLIDLRGNGGGHLSEATAMTGLFIDEGPIVQLKSSDGRIGIEPDPSSGTVYDGPLAVLVDRQSASASEIFAAAIQDYGRGLVIGQQTYGKGTVQNLINLDAYANKDEAFGQVTVTTGKYYRVTGGSTQHRGVIPDVDLPSIVDATLIGENTRDSALPWDQIEPTYYKAEHLDRQAQQLKDAHQKRAETNPNYQYLLDAIADYQADRDDTELSLNLKQRQAERKQARAERLARENERRKALGLETIISLEDAEDFDFSEVTLNASVNILLDYMLSNNATLTSLRPAKTTTEQDLLSE